MGTISGKYGLSMPRNHEVSLSPHLVLSQLLSIPIETRVETRAAAMSQRAGRYIPATVWEPRGCAAEIHELRNGTGTRKM